MRMSAQQGAVVAFELPYDASMIMFSTTPWKDLTCLMLVDLISMFFFSVPTLCQSQSHNLVYLWLQPASSGQSLLFETSIDLPTEAYIMKNSLLRGGVTWQKQLARGRKPVRVSRKGAIFWVMCFFFFFFFTNNSIHANAVAEGQWSIEQNWVQSYK